MTSYRRPEVTLAALTTGVRFVVVDVETTPADDGDHILSVGVVQVAGHGAQLATPVEWRCDPGVRIENTRVHGLTDADVAGERPFADLVPRLATVLVPATGERVVFVAHHAASDLGRLHLEHQRAGRSLPDVGVLDTLALARHLKLGAGGYRLPQVLAHFGLVVTDHHNALADAGDTAKLLHRLLLTAATAGHTDLDVLLATAQPGRLRVGDYPAYPAARRSRAARGSPFTFIDRPVAHQATHKKLPKDPSDADVQTWLTGLRECVALRCPLLTDKVERLTAAAREHVLDALLVDLSGHVAAGRSVDANATLGAAMTVAVRHVRAADAAAFHDRWAATFGATTRCSGNAGGAPYDACPDCRADRACPADVWPQPIAVALTGAQRNLNPRTAGVWLGPPGRLVEHAVARPAVAAHAAWLVATMLAETRPEDANVLAALADSLGLVEPRLVHRTARALAGAGDLTAAIAAATTAFGSRKGSTDRAWVELAAYRDALAARQAAAQRLNPHRPHRVGHSAPSGRPTRRRFTGAHLRVRCVWDQGHCRGERE